MSSHFEEVYQGNLSLLNFVNKRIEPKNFLTKENNSPPVKLSQIPRNSRKHESKHAQKWNKYKVGTTYHLDNGVPSTAPNPDDVMKLYKKVEHEKFLKIFKKVVEAPYKNLVDIKGNDKIQSLILRKKIKNEKDLDHEMIKIEISNINIVNLNHENRS